MRKRTRITALLLAAALLIGTAACGKTEPQAEPATETVETVQPTYADAPASVKKSETVYVNLDNAGKAQTISVTDWLHTDKGEVAVTDKTDLQNVADIKGVVKPVRDGDQLTWNMPTTDLYYKGTSDKALPVEFAIEYFLDGKKLSADQIAGKSGKAEIRVKMTNTCQKDGTYLPVLALGLLVLPEGVFSGVQVTNGMSIGDGAKQIVVGAGLPGMAESLHLKESAKIGSIEISDSFAVAAETDSFTLDNLYFAVLPLCSMDVATLIPGSNEEAAQFFTQVESVLKAVGELNLDQLLAVLSGEKLTELASMLTEAVAVYQKNEALLQVLSKYMTEENIQNISDLLTALQDPETADMLNKLNNPLLRPLLSNMPELLESIEALTPVLNDLQTDLQDPKVKEALEAMPETLQTLSELSDTLEKNSDLLNLLNALASENVITALQAFSDSADAQTMMQDLAENADELLPDLQKYVAFGKEYGLFTDAADGTEISLVFIYMTPSLHPAAVKAEEPETQAEPWYKKLFS